MSSLMWDGEFKFFGISTAKKRNKNIDTRAPVEGRELLHLLRLYFALVWIVFVVRICGRKIQPRLDALSATFICELLHQIPVADGG